MLILSVVFGRVSVPFPVNVMIACVLFIGVSLTLICCSCQIGCGDNSICPVDCEVVVVLLGVAAAAVVAAAAGVIVAMFDAAVAIIANVNKATATDAHAMT